MAKSVIIAMTLAMTMTILMTMTMCAIYPASVHPTSVMLLQYVIMTCVY